MSYQSQFQNVARLYVKPSTVNSSVVIVGVNFSRLAFIGDEVEFEHTFNYNNDNAITGLNVEGYLCADPTYNQMPYGYSLKMHGVDNGKVDVSKSKTAMLYAIQLQNIVDEYYQDFSAPNHLLAYLTCIFKAANIQSVLYEQRHGNCPTSVNNADVYYHEMVEDALISVGIGAGREAFA